MLRCLPGTSAIFALYERYMKKQINAILILMTCSTLAIICFQFYWSYQSYLTALKNFKVEANEALQEAIKEEASLRRQGIVQEYQAWLADSSQIVISCEYMQKYKLIKFRISEKNPDPFLKRNTFEISLPSFTDKLSAITPEVKQAFIREFTQDIIAKDLRAGAVVYYTQSLGQKLEEATAQSRVDLKVLDSLYANKLNEKDISTSFKILLLFDVPSIWCHSPD